MLHSSRVSPQRGDGEMRSHQLEAQPTAGGPRHRLHYADQRCAALRCDDTADSLLRFSPPGRRPPVRPSLESAPRCVVRQPLRKPPILGRTLENRVFVNQRQSATPRFQPPVRRKHEKIFLLAHFRRLQCSPLFPETARIDTFRQIVEQAQATLGFAVRTNGRCFDKDGPHRGRYR